MQFPVQARRVSVKFSIYARWPSHSSNGQDILAARMFLKVLHFSKNASAPSKLTHFIRLGNEAMNIELTTTNDDGAEVRQMVSAWTNSLLRLRSRPVHTPQRGEWQFRSATAQETQRSAAWRGTSSTN